MAKPRSTWGVHLTDPAVLRALGHPTRLRILDVLQARGGATATACSEVVGLSASACSWHLRQLAAVGLVRDAGARAGSSDGRQRVWEAAVPSWQFDARAIDADPVEAQGVDVAVTQALLQASDAAVEAHTVRNAQDQEPPAWREASLVSNNSLRVTAEELTHLVDQVMELLEPYRLRQRPTPGGDQRVVHAALRFVPLEAADEAPDDLD
ncbi:winged helix-turn-helix domain-containing protein [Pseudokineococcus sp. 5B2Z-1]|uniref:ArsR/SmtB family transcription factor n=1 Tax=Pseudokineococcus sp. 5B2Z-1 TaxID=3132744 RepID=UPI003097BB52